MRCFGRRQLRTLDAVTASGSICPQFNGVPARTYHLNTFLLATYGAFGAEKPCPARQLVDGETLLPWRQILLSEFIEEEELGPMESVLRFCCTRQICEAGSDPADLSVEWLLKMAALASRCATCSIHGLQGPTSSSVKARNETGGQSQKAEQADVGHYGFSWHHE